MKILKISLIALLVIFIAILVVGMFLPKSVYVSRQIEVERSQEDVFNFLNTYENIASWSPWHEIDSAMKMTYQGPATGVGASYSWASEHPKVGNGRQVIVASQEPSKIESELYFGNYDATLTGFGFTKLAENRTELSWYITFEFGNNPIERWFGLMMESWMAPDFEKGLAKMKTILEAN